MQSNRFIKVILSVALLSTIQVSCSSNGLNNENPEVEGGRRSGNNAATVTQSPPPQLSCLKDPSICNALCGEATLLPYSSTFCSESGSCICDCRDKLKKDCVQTPFTPCFQGCVRANPNPDAFLYEGGNCPITLKNGTVAYQCVCECSVRDDYEETNDVF